MECRRVSQRLRGHRVLGNQLIERPWIVSDRIDNVAAGVFLRVEALHAGLQRRVGEHLSEELARADLFHERVAVHGRCVQEVPAEQTASSRVVSREPYPCLFMEAGM